MSTALSFLYKTFNSPLIIYDQDGNADDDGEGDEYDVVVITVL